MSDLLAGTPYETLTGAVAAGLAAGALLPLLGLWVVLQRVVFLGVTLAQVAAAGVALGLVAGLPALPLGMGLTLVVVAGGFVGRRDGARWTDASLGALFCGASALALLFISRSAADLDEIQHVLHGNLIYASSSAAWLEAGVLLIAVLVLAVAFRPLLFSSFDPETSAALGLRPRAWQGLLFGVLAIVLSVSMRTTGSLLSFAMLVLPPLAALRLGLGLLPTFVTASALGLLGTVAGFALAGSADLHLESSITMTLFLLLPICAGWARHPLLGAALATAAVLAGTQLQPQETEPHHHHAPEVFEQSWHLDVHLTARAEGAALRVDWELDAVRPPDEAPGGAAPSADDFPESLWLVVTGSGLLHEHELVHDARELPIGTSRHRGSFLVEGAPPQTHLDGQLWTASMIEGSPIDRERGMVHGCEL